MNQKKESTFQEVGGLGRNNISVGVGARKVGKVVSFWTNFEPNIHNMFESVK